MLIPMTRNRIGVSPFETLYGVRRQLDRIFDEFSTGIDETWPMPTDVVETQDELRFTLEVAGLKPEDIELTVENGVLTVTGEKKMERREGETDDNYRLVERRYGRYTRSFRLPPTVDANRVEANYDAGVLNIRLPRAEEAKPRRIQIGVTDGSQGQQVTGDNR